MKTGFSRWSNTTLQTFVAGPLSFMWQGRTPVGICVEVPGMTGTAMPTLTLADIQAGIAEVLTARVLRDEIRDLHNAIDTNVEVIRLMQARAEKAEGATAELRELLSEVYEAQTAACIGNGGPCGKCLWCRVRAALPAEKETR